MKKTLSICIPSYNMEDYLGRCVDSLIVKEILDKLEIIIVNDGSTDKTLEIANNYKKQYPNSIIIIDKPNGHYGSCINAALKIATGKYFRVLDADDWVNTKVLSQFISKLEELNVDVVFNKYVEYYAKEDKYKTKNYPFNEYNITIDLNTQLLPIKWIFIQNITYRLDFLHEINYTQTEGICYTDNEYSFIPITKAKNIYLTDLTLSYYYIGRNEQSMSILSKYKNVDHFKVVLKSIINSSQINTNINYTYIKPYYIFDLTEQFLYFSLLNKQISQEEKVLLHKCITYLYNSNFELYNNLLSNQIFRLWYNKPFLFKVLKPILKLRYNH